MHPELLNGHPKATIIESFTGDVSVIRPGFQKFFEKNLKEAMKFITEQGWEINIEIIKGSPLTRKMIL